MLFQQLRLLKEHLGKHRKKLWRRTGRVTINLMAAKPVALFLKIEYSDQNIWCSSLIEFVGFFLVYKGKSNPKGIFLRCSLLCSIEWGMLKVSTTPQS